MSGGRGQTFLQGSIILIIANFIVKLIGFFFKVPLARLLGNDGMGLFSVSYQLYSTLFVIATAGIPIAVSKMVSESVARKRDGDAEKIFRIGILLLGIVGITGSAILFLFARPLADMIGNSRAYIGIMAIAPAVLFAALMSVYRGYFQGRQNMYPTAVSEVIEALGKLIIGFLLAKYLLDRIGVAEASAGAVFGVACGTFMGYIILVFIKLLNGKRGNAAPVSVRSGRSIAKELLLVSIPIAIGASVSSLTSLIDVFTVMKRLQVIPGITQEAASTLFGMYSGKAVTMFTFPPSIVTSLAICVVPAIAGAIAVGHKNTARFTTQSALRITILFALPCSVGLSVLASPILKIVYDTDDAAALLSKLAIAIVFVCLLSVTNAILQAYGRMNIPVVNMIIGGVIKITTNYFLIPVLNIDGAPIATTICYFTIVLLNFIWIIKVANIKFDIMGFIVKPIICGGALGVSAHYSYVYLANVLSAKLAGAVAMGIAGCVYLAFLFITRTIKREDIIMLPYGTELAGVMERLRLI